MVLGERGKHVPADADLAIEVEENLFVGVEVVQVEINNGEGLSDGRRFGGGQQDPFGGIQRRCAGADGHALGRAGALAPAWWWAGGEQRGAAGVGQSGRLAGVQGMAPIPND
ncbi:hypothetical protein [Streptomyces sp. C8S0]|uniref:hypothetical protein n=1 Tax=Streptomyces sp. C8S0 TaxID=2585716 RepID=UPI001868081D|nr:hypothetical protein [Streptomyces sp. C8S0]